MPPIAASGTEYRGFIPFTKIDLEKRTVGGWMTVEEPDRQRKIVDYESVKKAAETWAGNMREMHLTGENRAVGKAVEIVPDDAGRRIWLESYVSKSADGENTWTKIQEGILTGYSIGGTLEKRVPEIVKVGGKVVADAREYVRELTECSYVDLPAAPHATFALTKSADFLADLPEPEAPAEPEPVEKAAEAETPAPTTELAPSPVTAAVAALVADAPATTTEIPAVPASTEKAAEPDVTKAALGDMTDAHIAAEKIGLMIECAADGVDVAPLKTALAAVEAWGSTQAEAIGTPADDAQVDSEAPVPVVIVDYAYYAAVAGDLAKAAIARKDAPDAPVPTHIQQLYELAKSAGARDPEAPEAITKAAIAAAVDETVGSEETITKYAATIVDRIAPHFGQQFEAMKSGLLEELRRELAPMSETVQKIANRPAPGGPPRYAPDGRGLLAREEQPLSAAVAEAFTKAAQASSDPSVKEELGRLAAIELTKVAQRGPQS